jgi:hypothetical protein
LARYLFVTAATWCLPLAVDDLLAAWRERHPERRRVTSWPAVPRLAAEALAVGALFTVILVLRSRTSFDFIYFQFERGGRGILDCQGQLRRTTVRPRRLPCAAAYPGAAPPPSPRRVC